METKWVKRSKVFSKTWFFLIALFLLVVIPLALLTVWVNGGLAPLDKNGKEKVFVIKEKETISLVASRLQKEGFIRDERVFNLYLKLNCVKLNFTKITNFVERVSDEKCISNRIQAGSFKISPAMSVQTLALSLTKGRVDSWLTIKEGLRNEEVAALVAKNYSVKAEAFLKVAEEGYMFPDTYLFKVNSTASEIAAKMRATFTEKFSQEVQSGIEKQGLTSEEGVVLASIVEREAGKSEDAPLIASVFLNRLNLHMPLGSDVTVQYALGYDLEEKTWWKKDLTDQDLLVSGPYNTRVVAGLPPGSICNPGLSALKAVAEPAVSDNLYFLYDKDGNVHFAKTLEEHNKNKSLYL